MKLLQDLRFSKSSYMPWGRLVVRAIDFDDCLQLVKVFETMANLGAQVDVRATGDNYGGYAWTHFRHNFIGDTALHLALRCVQGVCASLVSRLSSSHTLTSPSPPCRQKKLKCAYMLFALGASSDIENDKGETAGT